MVRSEISVVVPTRNEQHNVPAFLASLPEDLTLIVVDASDDATPHLIPRLRPDHTTVIRSVAHIAEARQIGASAATTPWVLFTDADMIFAEDYFSLVTETIDPARGHAAVYGAKRSQDAFADYYRWFMWGQQLFDAAGIPAVSGSNLLIRRDALCAVGGFDPRLRCNEDSEIGFRLARQGYSVHFDPRLVVYERDHRRLARGRLRKTVHALMRCTLLYFNCMPERWRSHDWGYWQGQTPSLANSLSKGYEE